MYYGTLYTFSHDLEGTLISKDNIYSLKVDNKNNKIIIRILHEYYNHQQAEWYESFIIDYKEEPTEHGLRLYKIEKDTIRYTSKFLYYFKISKELNRHFIQLTLCRETDLLLEAFVNRFNYNINL